MNNNKSTAFNLKVIMDNSISDTENRQNIENLLKNLKIPHSNWENKLSGKGKYISFTIRVTIYSQELMHELYDNLKNVPGVKIAI